MPFEVIVWTWEQCNNYSSLRSLFDMFEETGVCKSFDLYRDRPAKYVGRSRSLKHLSTEISMPTFVVTFTFRWCIVVSISRLQLWTRISWEREEYCYTERVSLRGQLTLLKVLVSLLPCNVLFQLHFDPFAAKIDIAIANAHITSCEEIMRGNITRKWCV